MVVFVDFLFEIEVLGEKLVLVKINIVLQFIGQEQVVQLILVMFLFGGYGLLVGLFGLGKICFVSIIVMVMGLNSNWVQFIFDLMLLDIIGVEVLDIVIDGICNFRFIEGLIFCQLLMVDEINCVSL